MPKTVLIILAAVVALIVIVVLTGMRYLRADDADDFDDDAEAEPGRSRGRASPNGRAGSVASWNGTPPVPIDRRNVPRMLSLRLRYIATCAITCESCWASGPIAVAMAACSAADALAMSTSSARPTRIVARTARAPRSATSARRTAD